MMEMTIRPMKPEERSFSYSQAQEIMETSGCIGHLRGDMGSDGNAFFSSWDDHSSTLKTAAFKDEFQEVVNNLRFAKEYGGLLKSRSALTAYCRANPDSGFDGNYTKEYGFRIDTESYSYMVRCNPNKGDYNFYIYAYDQESLNKVLSPDQQLMNVLIVEPGAKPYVKAIAPGLESLQHEVGGYIEAVYPFEDFVAVICDEEGKLKGSTLNRALRDDNGNVYDILAGTFIIAGLGEDDFSSLSDEQIDKFSELFKTPEMFLNIGGCVLALPMEDAPPAERPSLSDQIQDASSKADSSHLPRGMQPKEHDHEH